MKNKMKTKKALLKRIKITGTGKWMFKRAFTSHLALNKSTKQKRHLRKSAQVNATNQAQLKRGLPYLNVNKITKSSLPKVIKHQRGRKILINTAINNNEKNMDNNNLIDTKDSEIIKNTVKPKNEKKILETKDTVTKPKVIKKAKNQPKAKE